MTTTYPFVLSLVSLVWIERLQPWVVDWLLHGLLISESVAEPVLFGRSRLNGSASVSASSFIIFSKLSTEF